MDIAKLIETWWNDLIGMIFPRVCEVCGRRLVDGEDFMCMHCDVGMPRTKFHTDSFNAMHQRLVGTLPVEGAAAWFEYHRSGDYVKLIHKAKYYDRPEIARAIGRRFSSEIQASGFFEGIDIILPIPMHWFKQLKRGYNQAEELAKGVSEITGIPVGDNLIMKRQHGTQTKRGAYERYKNVMGIFDLKHAVELQGMHVLLIDDVLTTGSTMLSAIETIAREVPTARISVLTAASTTQ